MKNKQKKIKGITLIALVVTIVVLLILAGVSIAMLTGDNGIIVQAKRAREENNKEGVREEINIGMMSIKTKAVSNGYIVTLEDIKNQESEYALEKELEIEWVDKNSNPALLKKDNIYCYIYDDLSFEVSETDETYSISANLENYTISNKRTRVLKDSRYETQIIANEFCEIESVRILLGETDITASVYNAETKTINIEKLTDNLTITVVAKIQLNNIETLVSMIDKTYGYTTIDEIINDGELLDKILNNDETLDYVLKSNEILTKLISNAKTFGKLANNEKAFTAICEDANARLAMYNNYTITESIIANSTIAKNVMKKSSRYQVVSIANDGGRSPKTLYNGKAFVLSISQTVYNLPNQCHHSGDYLSGPSFESHLTCTSTYGNDGLRYARNKFASKVTAAEYDHVQGGGWSGGTLYAAIFKI